MMQKARTVSRPMERNWRVEGISVGRVAGLSMGGRRKEEEEDENEEEEGEEEERRVSMV